MLLNFTKSEFYRATKMKSFYILPIVLLVLIFFVSMVYLKFDKSLYGLDADTVQSASSSGVTVDSMSDGFMLGFESGTQSAANAEDVKIWGEGIMWGADVASLFQMSIAGLDSLMLLAIFTGLFFGSVFATGSDKNLVIGNSRKELMFASRMLVILAYSGIMTLLVFIFQAIAVAAYGAPFDLGLDASVVKYFIYVWFLSFVFCSLVALVTILTRSKAAGIAFGIVMSMGILSLVISLVDLLVSKLTDAVNFSLANYTVTNNIGMLTLNSDGSQVIRALVVGLIYLAVSVTVIVLNNRKRDLC